MSTPLSCGGLVWGHSGDIPGYQTRGGATEDGRAASVTATAVFRTQARLSANSRSSSASWSRPSQRVPAIVTAQASAV